MLTDGRVQGDLLVRNTTLNVLAQVIQLVLAVVTIPYVLHGLGAERFGVLVLARVALSYFGIVELGLGRTTTKFVAEVLGAGKPDRIPRVVWTSFVLQALLGLLGGVAVALVTPALVGHVLRIPPALQHETQIAFYLIAVSVPLVICARIFRGVLEASQRFDLVNAVQVPTSALGILIPAFGVFVHSGLPGIFAMLIALWAVTAICYVAVSFSLWPQLMGGFQVDSTLVRRLLSYGGWVTVSDILAPIVTNVDRFLIGALVSVGSVAYYAVPYEIASRLLILPAALGLTLFPAFSALWGLRVRELERLYARSLKYILLSVGPIVILGILFAEAILRFWLSAEIARASTLVLQLLMAGMLLNGLSVMPANVLDGIGRPDLRAVIFLGYGILYVGMAWLLIGRLGIVGAALAWAVRGGLELLLFFGVLFRVLRLSSRVFVENGVVRAILVVGVLAVAVVAFAQVGQQIIWRSTMVMAICLLLYVSAAWYYVLDNAERVRVRRLAARLRPIHGVRG